LDAVESRDLDKVIKLLDRTFDEGVDTTTIVNQLTNNISEHLAEKPQLLPLLDSLIDVAKSPQPQLKLLSVLGMATLPKPSIKTAALLSRPHEFSASIEELEKKAVEDKPHDIEPDLKQNGTLEQSNSTTQNSSSNEGLAKEAAPKAKKVKSNHMTGNAKENVFDWSKLLDYTRKNHIALYCVLSNCGYEIDNDILTIYTNNKFHKKKLDDTKYSALLSKCLQEIGIYVLDIHTIPTALPPKDSQAAAVAVIMGGGEEVSIESI
jgi:hypothetical protein